MTKIKNLAAEDTKMMQFIRRPGKLPTRTKEQQAERDYLGYTCEKHVQIIQEKLHKSR